MHQIDHPTAVSGRFIEGSPPTPLATVVTDDWANSIQEEIVNVVVNTKVIPATALVKASEVQLRDVLTTQFKQQGPGTGYISGFWSKVEAFDSEIVKVNNGSARFIDSLSLVNLTLTSSFSGSDLKKRVTKSGQSLWTAGDDNRMLPSTVPLTKQWYYLFVIAKESGGTIILDVGMDTSIIASNLIAESGYRWHRRVGAFNIYDDTGFGFPIPFRSNGTKFSFTHFGLPFGSANVHDSTSIIISAGLTKEIHTPFVPPGIDTIVSLRISAFRNEGTTVQIDTKFLAKLTNSLDNDVFAGTFDLFMKTDGAGSTIDIEASSVLEVWVGNSDASIKIFVNVAPTGGNLQILQDTLYYIDPIGTDGLA